MHGNWYCIVLGSELGPMPWENLVELALKGVLKPQHDVHCGVGGARVEAGRIPELARHLAMVQTTSDHGPAQHELAPARAGADHAKAFEFSEPARMSATSRVEPPPSSRAPRSSESIAYAASTVEMPSSPPTASERVCRADLMHDDSALADRNVTTASSEPSTPRKASVVVVPPPAPSAMKPVKPAGGEEKPKKESKAKAAKRAAPSTSPRRPAPSRSLGIDGGKLMRATLGLAAVCAVGAGGYFGWQIAHRPRVDKSGRPVLSSVDDMRGKLNYARNKFREGQYFGDLKSQFEARLAAARPAVDSLPPGPLAESLKTALGLLGEMSVLAVARGADEDSLYLERDTKVESLLAQARKQLPP
ncbi:MAG TPA: hypothetical protein VGX76_13670 [Pirellulales bacterium]|jgi:hypothetical protein|nr:hypothetical protein [Pirellulales bacterium]